MNLTENLKRIRKEYGLSQEQLADKLGVSRQSVSKWESGQAYPEMDKMIKLCQLFDLNIDELLNHDIKKVNDIKESKNSINKHIEDFFCYITKTVNMFSSMKFKQKIKCLFEQVIIICILLIIFTIIGSICSNLVNHMLNIIPLYSVHSIIYNILEGIYGIIAFVLGVILVLHIFKIRYLDYYVVVDNNNIEDVKEDKVYLEKKEEKVIIRDPEHSGYKFISGLLKFFLWCIKLFVIFISIFFCFSLICLSMSLILSFAIVKTGLLFIGIFIGILGCIIINIIILYITYNFVINKKNNIRLIGFGLLLSFITIGLGIGFGILGFKDFNVISYDDSEYFIKDEYNISMKDNLFIHENYDISYIESDNDDIRIEIIHSNYTNFEITDNDFISFNYYESYDNYMNILRSQIDAFNDKKIYEIYRFKVNVYTSSDNIKRIQENRRNYYRINY